VPTIETINQTLRPFEKTRRSGHPENQTQRLRHPPDPSKTERVGHPENLNHSLSDDVPQWYHPTVSARQEEKSRKGWPPANAVGTVPVLDDSDFYPFGGERPILSSSGNTYKFTGKERDSESGLDDFGARYYSSQYGRFMSPDWSVQAEPVPYAQLDDPQSLNLYAYVMNNPLSEVDADGHHGDSPGKCDDCRAILEAISNGMDPSDALVANQLAQQQNNEIAGQINHETLGMKNSKAVNVSLETAEDEIAHVRLNGIKKWGSNEKAQKYASLVSAIEKGPGFKLSQQAVEQAIMEDSKGIDPTHGAIFYNMRTVGQLKHDGPFQGMKVHTYAGPFISPSKYKYIMTYGQ